MKLKEITNIRIGIYLKPSPDADTICLQVGDFDKSLHILSTAKASVYVESKSKSHLLQDRDILFAAKGDRNFCTTFNSACAEDRYVASSSFLVLQTKSDAVLPEYICWYLNMQSTIGYLVANLEASAIRSISKAMLGEVDIPIPPLSQQHKVVEVSRLQAREREIYSALSVKRQQVLENKLKTIISNGK